MSGSTDPHADQPVYQNGVPLDQASSAMVMLHGRGASAQDILTLAGELDVPGFSLLTPQAANYSWYPRRFLDPIQSNEPWLSSALRVMERILDQVKAAGITNEKIILLGFSQGACLALEYAVRNPQRYGGVVGLSGGLIGTDDEQNELEGSLDSTPVFMGCSQNDPHIPQERFEDTARRLNDLGGEVTARLYAGLGHGVNQDELAFVREMMASLIHTHSPDE